MGTINLRGVPDDLHKRLKVEAAMRGTSIKDIMIQAAQEWFKRQGSKRLSKK